MSQSTFPPPPNLPIPTDDGACDHLPGRPLPSLTLPSTTGTPLNLSTLHDLTLIFCYPRTATPSETVPDAWNAIPGARGCTPQLCSLRDSLQPLHDLGIPAERLFGLSTQSTEYQREVVERLKLPYALVSDEKLELVEGLGLPVFEWEGGKVVRRLTLAVEEGRVVKVWYPVFPSDDLRPVLEWLRERRT